MVCLWRAQVTFWSIRRLTKSSLPMRCRLFGWTISRRTKSWLSCRSLRCSPRRSAACTKAVVFLILLCSETARELTGTSFGQVEISGAQPWPLLGRARLFFQRVRDGEPSAKCGAVTVIERKKFFGRAITEQVFQPSPEIASGPGRLEPIAFQGKKGDFIERIDDAEAGIEFEAVDNSYL